MLKKVISIALILFTAAILFAKTVEVRNLIARSSGNNISLKWNVSNETNLKQFEIERSLNNDNSFMKIGEKQPNGSLAYEFIDSEAHFIVNPHSPKAQNKLLSDQVYYYRLKLINKDGTSTFSENTSPLVHNVNSVKRTWGMLKEMFR